MDRLIADARARSPILRWAFDHVRYTGSLRSAPGFSLGGVHPVAATRSVAVPGGAGWARSGRRAARRSRGMLRPGRVARMAAVRKCSGEAGFG
jgi:hypothetical protein